MELTHLIEDFPENNIYGLMGNINITTNNKNYCLVSFYRFPTTVKEYLSSPKDLASLQMVGLSKEYLTKEGSTLSLGDIKKINLAKALIENKNYLILEYFEKELTNKEKAYFQRLFKKLTEHYHKTIILFTNDLTFLWEYTKSIIYVNNNKDINIFMKDNNNILKYVENPPISEFLSLLKKKVKIKDYKTTSELLKEIYRLKEADK